MITENVAITRIVVSLVLGAAIGIERQIHRHPAGLRTFTFICMSATLAMLVSIYICQTNTNLLNGDPGRIAAQVLTGIGFLGAGLIIKKNDDVMGLTTAACIFMTAVIGLAVGAGMIKLSVIVTGIVLILLFSSQFIKFGKNDASPKP
ncbi:MAG: MgtC/SapB family protein [Bacteroidaceae bacterium]|nr:MgtC/SapB family protein [Bacteroidaceae bacterium]